MMMTKSDIDEMSISDRDEFVAEMRSGAVEAVKNMKAFSAIKHCMDDGYTFVINYRGWDEQQFLSFTLKPEDYK